ncbi:protein FAM183A [Coturnix japonica]|uniref:protein FAM183A n=1 Tax=Coturnix japonica TaxID=93934 RepID=UPI0007774D96|nr:protein FAM183A [Coturnix japonica]
MSARKEKEPPDAVHLNRLLCERVRKELRCQRLHTEHCINPLRRVHTVAQKPMSWHDNIEEPADARFLNIIHEAVLGPTKKYSEPQTESQEIGWNTKPLIDVDRTDRRFFFPHRKTMITEQVAPGAFLKKQEEKQQK